MTKLVFVWAALAAGLAHADAVDDLPPRWNAGVVYDASRDVVVLYGGYGCGDPTVACEETWELVIDVATG